MQWINVKDKLPNDYIDVIVYSKSGDTFVAKLLGKVYGWQSLSFINFTVTHWMPLPEPPNEDNE